MLASVACFVASFLLLGLGRSDTAQARNGTHASGAGDLAV